MKMHFDVVIIGAGIMGASLSYYLTKLGLKNIALCEQGIPPGNGATHKSGGFIRIFHENEWYTKRAVESYDTYADWGNKIGGSCGFKKTGFSFITDSTRSDQLRANAKKVNRYCSQVSVLSPDEFQQFQPDFSLEGIGAIVYEPNGGYADPAKTALTFIKQSEKKGMKLLEGVKVERILHHRKKITGIQTNIGSIRADKYVVANNIWANFLLEELGLRLPMFKKSIGLGFIEWDKEKSVSHLTSCIDETIGTYFRIFSNYRLLFGVQMSHSGALLQDRSYLHYGDMQIAKEKLVGRLPLLHKAEYLGSRLSFDSYTSDGLPIIGVHPEFDDLYLMVGFNGSGFKIAPSIGLILAREIFHNERMAELNNTRMERFNKQSPI